MKRLVWSLAILCLFALATAQAQEGTHTFLGYSRDGEVVFKPSASGNADGWSESFDNMLNARSKITLSDLAPPKNLTYSAEGHWIDIQIALKKLVDEQDKLFSGEAFKAGATLFDMPTEGSSQADSRWESFEFQVSQKTAEEVAKYKLIKESYTADPTQKDEKLTAFVTELNEAYSELSSKVRELMKEMGDGAELSDDNFIEDFFSTHVSSTVTEKSTFLDPANIVSSPSEDPMIGKTIRLTEDVKTIALSANQYSGVVNAWKQKYAEELKDPNLSEKKRLKIYQELRESAGRYLYSSPGNRGGLRKTNAGPRKGGTYYVRHIIKNDKGETVGLAVSSYKTGSQTYIIPYHGDKEGPVRRYFTRPIEHPLGKNFAQTDIGNERVLKEWARAILTPLSELEELTSLHPVIGVEPKTTEKQRVDACNQSHAQKIFDKAKMLHEATYGARAKALNGDYRLLKQLYESLVNIEESINSVLLYYGPNETRRKERVPLLIGSAQNYVAALIAMIGEKYSFDTETKVLVSDGVYSTQRKSRIGNTYDYGTNNQEQVRANDYLMSGPYRMHDFRYLGKGKEVSVAVNYIGLQSNAKQTNPFFVAILDKTNPAYEKLKEELAVVKRWSSGGFYRRPITECDTFKKNPDNLVLAYKEITSQYVQNHGSDSTVEIKFTHPNEEPLFTVYQETAGLTYAPWIDYDEVTTVVTAKNCTVDEEIDPDGFRIIVDASDTMKSLFPKVVAGLKENLKQLDAEYLATEYTSFRPVHLFSSKNADHTKNSPYSLHEFDNTAASGASWISEAIRTLGNNIPDKPWILIIVSDFHDDFFKVQNWATATNLQTPAQPGKESRRLPPLFKEAPREMWLQPGRREYVINNAGKQDEGWPRLTKVYCISVQSLLTQRMPISVELYKEVLKRLYPNDQNKQQEFIKDRALWDGKRRGISGYYGLTANWLLGHVSHVESGSDGYYHTGGRNGIYVDLMDHYHPNPSMMNEQKPDRDFQNSLNAAMNRIYKTHALNKKRGGSQ